MRPARPAAAVVGRCRSTLAVPPANVLASVLQSALVAGLALGLAAPLSPNADAADRLILRDLTILRDRTVVRFDEDGVRLDDDALITWDRIERGTIAADRQADFDRLLAELGRPLFRLRLRLKTGDDAGLSEFAEPLAARYAERSGASAYLVRRALMKGRIAAGRREAAVAPYLSCLAAVWNDPSGQADLPPEQRLDYEPATGATAELAPVWFDAEAARSALPDVRRAAAQTPEPRPEAMRIYFATLAAAAGDTALAERAAGGLGAGVEAIDDWRETLAVALDVKRAADGPAFQRLEARLDRWSPACRPAAAYWTGLALLHAESPDRRLDGVLRLLRLPALDGVRHPELAAAALAAAAAELARQNDAAGAAALRRELANRYPRSTAARSLDANPPPDSQSNTDSSTPDSTSSTKAAPSAPSDPKNPAPPPSAPAPAAARDGRAGAAAAP